MRVIITPKAEKQYSRLSKHEQAKIRKKLTLLEIAPLAGKKLSGELTEQRTLRAWPYRIIYYMDKSQKLIYVTTILHRQGVYK